MPNGYWARVPHGSPLTVFHLKVSTTIMAKVAAKPIPETTVKDITGENFSFKSLLDESFKGDKSFEGSVVEGTVVAVDG